MDSDDLDMVRLDNESMDRLVRGLAVTVRTDKGEFIDVMLDEEGQGFVNGRLKNND